MTHKSVVISLVIIVSFAVFVAAQSNNATRCFQFTWLGHRYNNDTVDNVFLNATCLDSTRLASGIPCVRPLVVSYDGSRPDVDYIWQNYPNASCNLVDNDVCAIYTFSFNGRVENSTYFCTRAVNDMDNAMVNGCYEQVNGSHSTKVCLCRSLAGARPCNSGYGLSTNYLTILLISIAMILQHFANKT